MTTQIQYIVENKSSGRGRKMLLLLLLFVMLLIVAFPAKASATTYKKSTVYSEVYKSGSYAYCLCHNAIYKVNLNTDKVTRLRKNYNEDMGDFKRIKLYKGYVYYYDECLSIGGRIARVSTSGKNYKVVDSWTTGKYAISDGTLYVSEYYDDVRTRTRRMSVSGNNKKSTSARIKLTIKRTNVSGYSIAERVSTSDTIDEDGEPITVETTSFYLKRPKHKLVYLGKFVREIYD